MKPRLLEQAAAPAHRVCTTGRRRRATQFAAKGRSVERRDVGEHLVARAGPGGDDRRGREPLGELDDARATAAGA